MTRAPRSPLLVSLNGRLVDEGEATVSVFDRGFLLGDGIFESMRVVGGRIFRLDRHLERLRQSARLIGLDLQETATRLDETARGLIDANGLEDARLRMTVTRGPGRPGEYLDAAGPPTVVITAAPFRGLDARHYDEGVEVSLSSRPPMPAAVLDPAIKSTSRLHSVLARLEARDRGAFEALFIDAAGHLTEGTVSNMFLVSAGILKTPATPSGCLPGVTRQAVIELARAHGLPVREERLPRESALAAEEIFLTNSSWDVLPVARIDGAPVGPGRPGPVALRLLSSYRSLVHEECRAG